MPGQPSCKLYKLYGWSRYKQGRFCKPTPRSNRRQVGVRYWETRQRIEELIAQLPGVSIMGNPTEDDSGSTAGGEVEEFTPRTNPNCKSLQKDLEKIHILLSSVRTQVTNGLDNVDTLLTDTVEGVIPRVSALETSSKHLTTRVRDLEDKLALVVAAENVTLQASPQLEADQEALKARLETAAVVISSLEKKLQSANSRILYNTQLHNVNKYRISGIPFVEGEDPVVETTTFLKSIMKVTVNSNDIITASRMPGTITVRIQGNKVVLPPQMFVQVTTHLQKRIAANMGELEGKTDPTDGHFYRVKQQLPDAMQGARQHFNPVVADVQEKNKGKPKKERIPFYFQGTDLFVDGKKVKEPIKPPSPAAIISISPTEQKVLNDINPPLLAQDAKNGSKFFGYAVRVYDTRFLKKVYLRLRQLHLAANHIMMAFRVESPDNPDKHIEGSCHDDESHGDVVLSQVISNACMSNIAVFVVRYYGGTPLRSLRLKIIGDTARAALHKLRFPDADGVDNDSRTPVSEQVAPPASPSGESSDTSPMKRFNFTAAEHSYGRSSPQLFNGRGGILSSVGRGFKPYQESKKQKLDFDTTMGYSIDYV